MVTTGIICKKKMHILASNFSAKQHKLKVREGVIFFFLLCSFKTKNKKHAGVLFSYMAYISKGG